jgi:hypothetical protein
MKPIYISILLVFTTITAAYTQTPFEKATKQISVETGYQYVFKTNYTISEKFRLFAKLESGFIRFPSLGNKTSHKIQTMELKIGVRFK